MQILSALFGAFLLFLLQTFIYRRFWSHNLLASLNFSRKNAIEGEEVVLHETIINRKLLPLPFLKVKFIASKYFNFSDSNNDSITDNYYRSDLLPIMMYQKLTRSLPFICTHRGYYSINNMDLVCSDMFLANNYVDNSFINIDLYVYPKTLDTDIFYFHFKKMLGTVITKRFINEDPFEFRSIREYQTYDSIKSINWKASAKTGAIKVNANEYTASKQVKIFLNLEAETNWKYEDLEEESIRLVASFAFSFIKQGIPVSFYTNGRDIITKEIPIITAGSGEGHIDTLNRALSRIDTSLPPLSFVNTVHKECLPSNQDDYYLFISSYQKEDLQTMLFSLLQVKTEFTWIIPTNRDVTITANEKLTPYIIPWNSMKDT